MQSRSPTGRGAPLRMVRLRVRIPPRLRARSPTGRGGSLKTISVRVRISPGPPFLEDQPARPPARVANTMGRQPGVRVLDLPRKLAGNGAQPVPKTGRSRTERGHGSIPSASSIFVRCSRRRTVNPLPDVEWRQVVRFHQRTRPGSSIAKSAGLKLRRSRFESGPVAPS